MAIFKRPALKTQQRKRREIPQGLFQKCPGCNEVIHEIELNENERVCPRCNYHFALSAKDRIASLLDPETFVETDAGLRSIDTLKFQGMASYKDRLRKYQDITGLTDAVLSGYGMIEGYKVAIAVMDFSFLAATMGSVVGERITRTIEYGTANRAAVIIVCASGGARMYEGMLSLMQMAKTSGALARHAAKRLPLHFRAHQSDHRRRDGEFWLVRRCHHRGARQHDRFRRTARDQGNHASGFAGRFQTAEFLEEHGLIDLIVHRKKMRPQISQFISYFSTAQ